MKDKYKIFGQVLKELRTEYKCVTIIVIVFMILYVVAICILNKKF